MRLFIVALFVHAAAAQDWDSLSAVKPDARLRVSLRAGRPFDGPFGGYTPSQVTVATRPVDRREVKRIEGYRPHVWSRWKRAGVAAAIGFGGGFVIGAAAAGSRSLFASCVGRLEQWLARRGLSSALRRLL